MKKNQLLLIAFFIILGLSSCRKEHQQAENQTVSNQTVSRSVLNQIKSLGFDSTNVKVVKDGYIVEGDIFLSEKSLKDSSRKDHLILNVANTEQYRTYGYVHPMPKAITVSVDASLSQNFSDGVNNAIARYNALNLNVTFQRVSSSANISILGFNPSPNSDGSITLGVSSNPPDANGNVNGTIQVNTNYYANSPSNIIASVIQHELGHAIGLRHTDYYNRTVSCGVSSNPNNNKEPDLGDPVVGSILVPGTPGKADDTPNSLMLACNNSGIDRTFNNDDILTLQYLYGNYVNLPNPIYRFRGKTKFYLLTMNYAEAGYYGSSFIPEGIIGKMYLQPPFGTVPLYRYKSSDGDYLYLTIQTGISGYPLEGICGYVYASQETGTIPLYRFYKSSFGHFFTTNYQEGVNAGLTYEGIACYILQP